MMSPRRLFVGSLIIAFLGVLSACSQPAAPIKNVRQIEAPVAVVAIPVSAPPSNFTGSNTPQIPQPQAVTAQSSGAQIGAFSQSSQPDSAQTTTAAVVVSGPAREGERRLALVQACQANAMGVRDQCSLGFADTRGGREVTSQVQAYYLSNSANLAPKVTFENYCGAGWLATVVSMQGTVQGGGVQQAQAAVCGHPSAGSALTALFSACDLQTQGGCRQSTTVKVAWGYWDGQQMPGTDADIGRPYSADRFADMHMCDSALPLEESGVCPPSAAVPLRLLGLP